MSVPLGVLTYSSENIGNFERTDTFSVSVWIYPTASKNQAIVSRMDPGATLRGWFFYAGVNQRLAAFLINDVTATPNPNEIATTSQFARIFNLNAWSHIVMTYSGSSLASGVIFYVNGVAQTGNIVTHDTLTATIKTTNSVKLQVGNNPVYSFFTGNIDEVQIYSKVLSQAEVTTLYNSGTGTATMVSGSNYLQYHFNESSGFQCSDSTNQGRGATTAGAPSFVTGKLGNAIALNGSTQYVQSI